MKDQLGNELSKGDLVLYGYRSGNSGGICFAIVTNPEKSGIYSGGYSQGFGAYGKRLIRVGNEHELNDCPYNKQWLEKYNILLNKAKDKGWI